MISDIEKRLLKKISKEDEKDIKKIYQRIVRCFLRLSENQTANSLLTDYIPKSFFS